VSPAGSTGMWARQKTWDGLDGLPVLPDHAITSYEALCAVTSSAAWLGYQKEIGAIPADTIFVAEHAAWKSGAYDVTLEMGQVPASQSATAPISQVRLL